MTRWTAAAPGVTVAGVALDLRVSDQDRERTVDRLRVAAAEGYLDAAELEDRVAAALTARTRSALAAVVADLPAVSRSRSRWRGGRAARNAGAFVAVNASVTGLWLAEVGARDPWLLGSSEFPYPVVVALAWAAAAGVSARRRGRSRSPAAICRRAVREAWPQG